MVLAGETIDPDDLPPHLLAPAATTGVQATEESDNPLSLKRGVRDLEETLIRRALELSRRTARGPRSCSTSATARCSTRCTSTALSSPTSGIAARARPPVFGRALIGQARRFAAFRSWTRWRAACSTDPAMGRAPIRRDGFTLLELLCALGMLSVLLAIALPRVSAALPGLLLDQAARRLVSDLELARVKAVNRNTRVRTICDLAAASIESRSSPRVASIRKAALGRSPPAWPSTRRRRRGSPGAASRSPGFRAVTRSTTRRSRSPRPGAPCGA